VIIAFLVPVPDLRSGWAIATSGQRIIIATTRAEIEQVPASWKPIDLQKTGRVSVTEWMVENG